MSRRRSSSPLRLALRIAGIALWVQYKVCTVQLPRILDEIEAKPRRPLDEEETRFALWLLERMTRWKWFVIRKNCLKKGLLYYFVLVTGGWSGLALHVGVVRPQPDIAGHCWLTRNGDVFMDTAENVSKYTIMYSRGG